MGNLRAQQWYNGDPPRNLSGFINDKSHRLIGWATMRQLRVKLTSCHVQQLVSACADDYSFSNEEKRSFQPGWLNETSASFDSSIRQAFQYRTGDQLNTYIYVGDHETYNSGGYVYEFRGRLNDMKENLTNLRQLSWIDSHTRAIIIQLTLYNPNVQLFTSVTFLIEFLSNGGISPQSRFETFHLHSKSPMFFVWRTSSLLFFFSMDIKLSMDLYHYLLDHYHLSDVR